jgi:hypothetical protein
MLEDILGFETDREANVCSEFTLLGCSVYFNPSIYGINVNGGFEQGVGCSRTHDLVGNLAGSV